MISGVVKFDEACVRVRVRGPTGIEADIEGIIDTGFSSSLTLPPSLIAHLKLSWQSLGRGVLADGSECLFDVYAAEVIWDRKVRRIVVDEADTEPLIGMRLLKGFELKVQVRPRGKVTIKALRSK